MNMVSIEACDFEKFKSTLSDLLSTVNETRTKAEEIYDGIESTRRVFLLLAAIGATEVPPEESGLAAILLRRLLSMEYDGGFSKLQQSAVEEVKIHLLRIIHCEMEPTLRKKISDAIAELARSLIDDDGNNHWPEFLTFLFEAASSPDPQIKELALHMFASVPGVFGNQQSRYIDVIHNMLLQSLTDQSSLDVQFAAVKATASFLVVHEKENNVQKKFSDCLNLLLQFLARITESADERIDDVLRYLIDLVEKCPQSFRSSIDILFELCLKCIANPSVYPESTRHLALEVIIALAEAAPAMIRKLGSKHIPMLIAVLFKMMTDLEDDPDWDFNEDENDEESDSNNLVAEAALDRLACALGGKTIFPYILNSLSTTLGSPDWKCRYAGLMTISAVGEGCIKQMNDYLSHIVEGVLPFLMDSHSRVRYAACNALGQMASDFGPEFQEKFPDRVINALLPLLGENSSPRVQAHAGAALVNFFEDSPKEILETHMKNITDQVGSVLSSKLNEVDLC